MGRVTVKIDSFSNVVKDMLEETKKLTDDALISSIDKTAKEVVSRTKSASPKKTGKYAGGWGSKVTLQAGRGKYGRTVYNSSKGWLVHLLEHGHGGPHPAGPHPHILSDEETESILERNLRSEIEKG